MKDFITNEYPLTGEEEAVAFVEAKQTLSSDDFKLFNTGRRKLCPNCTNGFHNQYEEDEVCKKHGCKCQCQQYYIGRNGKTLVEWGKEDTTEFNDEYFKRKKNRELDKLIQTLNLEHSKLKDLGIIFAHKICTRCGIKGRFEGWACKPCREELNEPNIVSFNKVETK